MLEYNFPSYSVGECRPIRGPGRREIGHGALAERSLAWVLPKADVFPYTIKVISDITESNGSSSMASVCSGTLGMMDAGIPLTQPVAGISIGLVKEGEPVRAPDRHHRRRRPLRRHGLQDRRDAATASPGSSSISRSTGSTRRSSVATLTQARDARRRTPQDRCSRRSAVRGPSISAERAADRQHEDRSGEDRSPDRPGRQDDPGDSGRHGRPRSTLSTTAR